MSILKELIAKEIAIGRTCYRCEGDIPLGAWPKQPCRTLCWLCHKLDTADDEVLHEKYVRCPACGNRDEAQRYNIPSVDTDVNVRCSSCDHEYEIAVFIDVEYMSPARDAGITQQGG